MATTDILKCTTGALLKYLADCDDRGIEMPPWARTQIHRRISAHPNLLTLLQRAHDFLTGFEDDSTQEGVAELLKQIRDARDGADAAITVECEFGPSGIRRPTEVQFVQAAQRLYHQGGEIEVDDDDGVSVTDDNGAWVRAWVWVDDEAAWEEMGEPSAA